MTHLETDLRHALDSGDLDRITAAAAAYERATQPERPRVTLLGAALYYAEQGLRVFPLSPGSKIPFAGSDGCLAATSNTDLIHDWWERDPDSNIGLATGHLIDVVDIDGAPGQKSRAERWEDTFERIDSDKLAVALTPRPGGMHLYVPATGDGNRAGIFPGVDYRGRGGYVLAPPSVLVAGKCKPSDTPGTYRFLGAPAFDFKGS